MGGGPSQLSPTDRPSVLIIGGGYAGTKVANLLDPNFFVVLIDRKDHLTHTVALPRGLVEPQRASSMHIPYHRLMKNGGIHIQAHVTSISPTAVTVHGLSSPITGFQYLIIATGSSYSLPARIGPPLVQAKLPLMQTANSAIQSSSRILIIGAGPVGVEIAGEIATDYSDKEVTLVSAHDYLGVPGLPEKFTATVQGKLQAMRVKVIKGVKVTIPESVSSTLAAQDELYLTGQRTWQLTNGQQVEADLTFFSVGSVLNTSTFTPLASLQTKVGDLRTNEWLQLEGHPNVFVVGDANGLEARKLAFIAGEQGKWLGKNFTEDSQAARGMQGLTAWKAPPPVGFVSLGRNAGAGMFDGSSLPSWVVKMVKAKDMMVERTRKEMGVGKGEGVKEVGEGERREKIEKLVAGLKMSREDAVKFVSLAPQLLPAIKELPARDHL